MHKSSRVISIFLFQKGGDDVTTNNADVAETASIVQAEERKTLQAEVVQMRSRRRLRSCRLK